MKNNDLDHLSLSKADFASLVRHARRSLRGKRAGKSDAEDLVQDAWTCTAKLVREGKRDKFETQESLMKYLMGAITNKAASAGRRVKLERLGENAIALELRKSAGQRGDDREETAIETLEHLALEFLGRPEHQLAKLFPNLPRSFISKLATYYTPQPKETRKSVDRRFAVAMLLLHGAEKEGAFWSAVQKAIRSSMVFEMLQIITEDTTFEEAMEVIAGPYPKEVDDAMAGLREDFDATLRKLSEVVGKHTRRRDWRRSGLQAIGGPTLTKSRGRRKG